MLYTVVIKNRILDEKTVARIRTCQNKENADLIIGEINCFIDNNIYFADIEEEDADEENN